MPSAQWTIADAGLFGIDQQIVDELTGWGLAGAVARRYLVLAAANLRPGGTLTVDYDAEDKLVSLDVWHDGRRVYGIDDWLGV